MKITFEKKPFALSFAFVSEARLKNMFRPALECVKCVAENGRVALSATDGSVYARVEVGGVEILEPGETLIPASTFKQILAESDAASATLETQGTSVVVYGDRFRYRLATCPTDEFLPETTVKNDASYRANARSFRNAIRRARIAADDKNTHYALGGVLFEFDGARATAVSTDGRRLSRQEFDAVLVGTPSAPQTANVPTRALSILDRALSLVDDNDDVLVATSENFASFRLGSDAVVTTTLLEKNYPNWRKIIPSKNGKVRVDVFSGVFASAVRRAQIVATQKSPGVTLNFSSENLVCSASGAEVGDASSQFPILFDATPVEIQLDASFLLDFLSLVDKEETIAFYVVKDRPVFFETSDDWIYVVMPITANLDTTDR